MLHQPKGSKAAAVAQSFAAGATTPLEPLRPCPVPLCPGCRREWCLSSARRIHLRALKLKFPSKFADPVIQPLVEFAWHEYLQEKKKELRGEVWAYASPVMCFVGGQLLGDEKELLRWSYHEWDYRDFKPEALYQAIAEDFYTKYLKSSQHVFVYLEIAIEEQPVGRLLFELFSDVCPRTCENFRALCAGGATSPRDGRELTYKNSLFHRLVKNGWIQGGGVLLQGTPASAGRCHRSTSPSRRCWTFSEGQRLNARREVVLHRETASWDGGRALPKDIITGKGDGGESIYGPTFEDESFSIRHKGRGVLGMANKGHHSNSSQFYITLQPAPYLDKKYVAFGQLIEGTEVLQRLEAVPTHNERPIVACKIINCGTFEP
ncbi:putative inactive peptidyl-prolyl cis-trans isomerase-like 6 isoform 2-T2 [Theristicus caerulescens]